MRSARKRRDRGVRVVEASAQSAIDGDGGVSPQTGPIQSQRRVAIVFHGRMALDGHIVRNIPERVEIAQGEIGRKACVAQGRIAAVDRDRRVEALVSEMGRVERRRAHQGAFESRIHLDMTSRRKSALGNARSMRRNDAREVLRPHPAGQ